MDHEQSKIMKFCFKLQKSAKETHEMLKLVYSDARGSILRGINGKVSFSVNFFLFKHSPYFFLSHLVLCIRFAFITKLRGLSPHANYTDRAAAAGRPS